MEKKYNSDVKLNQIPKWIWMIQKYRNLNQFSNIHYRKSFLLSVLEQKQTLLPTAVVDKTDNFKNLDQHRSSRLILFFENLTELILSCQFYQNFKF